MSELKEIKESISELNGTLKKYQREIKEWVNKPEVTAWLEVNLQKHVVVLKALGLPVQEIASSKIACQKEPKNLSGQISVLANAVGDLQADLIGSVDPTETSLNVKKLNAKQKLIESKVANLYTHVNFLIKARQQFNESLTMQNLLIVSQFLSKKQAGAFEKGLALFRLFFPNGTGKNGQSTMGSYQTIGGKLISRFQGLDLSALPNLTEEIVHHQVEIGLLTAQQISAFISAIELRFKSEQSTKKQIEEKLEQLEQQKSLISTLTELKITANSLRKLVIGLSGKYGIYEHICRIPSTYEYLNIFHLSLKNSLIPQAQIDINMVGSAINPATIAAKKTKTFFFGLKGMVRSIKLMYSSIKGKQAINEEELLQVLEKAIHTCRIFYGRSATDIKKIKTFIDNALKEYARPFPYTPLFKLVKKTLVDYGSEMEDYVQNYTIDEKYRSHTDIPIPARLGELSKEIHKKSQHFSKLVKGL